MTTETPTYFGHVGKLRTDRELGGSQWLFSFENGYGASVITNQYSYGGDRGLFELAVLHGDDSETAQLCYATPITDDVIGHQSHGDISALLDRIAALPTVAECSHRESVPA